MPKITYIQPNGVPKTVEVAIGSTVMEGAIDHDVDGIVAACGGSCSCSTCHVHVDAAWFERVGPPQDDERDTLQIALEVLPNSRLSCQIEVTRELDGLVVQVAKEQA
jgi:2Fe-2S ferredoxin